MSLSRETVLELMALADDELEGEAKERAAKLALDNQEARRVVDAMRAADVRIWLSEAVARRAAAADGIADDVMARLASEGVGLRSDRRAGMARTARSAPPSRVVARSAAMVSALAIAATIGIYILHPSVRIGQSAPVASVGIPNGEMSTSREIAAPIFQANTQGVQVDEIDSAGHVSIFEISAIANADAPSSVVVWIDDDPSER